MSILRKLRGVLGTASVWCVAWAPLGLVWAASVWADAQLDAGREQLIPFPPISGPMIMCAAWGFVAGAAFALGFAAAERRRGSLGGLSLPRTALWGALGGLALPASMVAAGGAWLAHPWLFATFSALSVAFGAATATGSLVLARRADMPLLALRVTPVLDAPAT